MTDTPAKRAAEEGGRAMSEELKPCPFCGGSATLKRGFDLAGVYWFIECENFLECVASKSKVYWSDGKNRAIAAWNRRARAPMTSVIKWKRFNGTEETLPPVYEKVLLKSEESFRLGGEWFFEDETRREIKIGDEWTYWPTPPEAAP